MKESSALSLSRRGLVKTAGASALGAASLFKFGLPGLAFAQTPVATPISELVIDLDGAPDNLDPALTYSVYDWSIAHSIYDALLHFDTDGTIVPLAAESFTTRDAMTFDVKLRAGLTFHDGSPVTTAAITRAVDHLKAAKSQVTDLFTGITKVNEIDDLTAQIVTETPSPWLPSQIAVWLMLFPEGMSDKTWTTAPVGSGPYKFDSYDAGNQIVLVRNEAYTWDSPKGKPIADKVTYRFVTESATRVADLSTKTAEIIDGVPTDQRDAVKSAGGTALVEPILGTAFIRIATDTKPFDDARVRQAVNYAVDLQTIATQLVAPESKRIASLFPDPRGLGFDPNLKPFAFDQDKAKSLLAEAGYPDGFKTTLEMVAGDSTDFAEAIVAQLADVGIEVEIKQTELAAFNADWPTKTAPPLRYATWRPMYDPHTLLSLVFVSTGYLSRYQNPKADDLIIGAAKEADPEKRKALYQQLGTLLQEEPAAIYLWNVVSTYGVAPEADSWQPRGDDYVIATSRS
ncbi:MAG TPA: ABC transporter substrate-binding protein [Thermomicrobiales bacterium]|nr:ABC transporter substrate-binding protein [Thermomicrobiales bacterium]